MEDKPNCLKCEFYFVTWDKSFPTGCRAMGFKSKQLPCKIVYESSGMHCIRFKPRKPAS